MAPEVMNRERYDSKADIWSLGITALELFKGYPPLAKFEPLEILIRTVQGEPPSFQCYSDNSPVKPSANFTSLISCVLKKDPSQRYSADKVLSHRWITSLADQGKEDLLELLKTIPDLQGRGIALDRLRRAQECVREEYHVEFHHSVDVMGGCEGREEKKEKKDSGDWLKKFNKVGEGKGLQGRSR